MAQEATRDSGESAPLVKMIGTFAPERRRRGGWPPRYSELFGEIGDDKIGDDKNVRLSGDRRVEFLDKRRGGAARGVKRRGPSRTLPII